MDITDQMVNDIKSYFESYEGYGESGARAMDAIVYVLDVLGIKIEGITGE